MSAPRIAVISFPGNNCEVESMRAIKEAGMEAVYFRWNEDRSRLSDIDGYFLPGGFAYEDRGRSGMVAARDPIMEYIGQEAERGKVVVGNCNGAQVLVESGLIPLGEGLQMSLARNAIQEGDAWKTPGFLSEWIWMIPSCKRDRCAVSDWEGPMHVPIAHGEGRFTTKDADLIAELKKNDQIAFSYCDVSGIISPDPIATPNGSVHAIAGMCNPAGNVVAIMPHPERTPHGAPYFASMRKWILAKQSGKTAGQSTPKNIPKMEAHDVPKRVSSQLEIFIDTIIVNNEERTIEQALHRVLSGVRLKQWKYYTLPQRDLSKILDNLSHFNPNKERAFIRQGNHFSRWNADAKKEDALDAEHSRELFSGTAFVRRDIPDTGAASLPTGSATGICYLCNDTDRSSLMRPEVLEIFANPHASVLEELVLFADHGR